ncbi:uncharacterized protein [Anabrus simplex]|uniref:uncharacterized protein n=1 Tax=Anabrus simplex TaxID=316456 RepID=UPI0035A29273
MPHKVKQVPMESLVKQAIQDALCSKDTLSTLANLIQEQVTKVVVEQLQESIDFNTKVIEDLRSALKDIVKWLESDNENDFPSEDSDISCTEDHSDVDSVRENDSSDDGSMGNNHEMICCQEPTVVSSSEPEVALEDLSCDQDMFLNYFELQSSSSVQTSQCAEKHMPQFKTRSSTSVRYATIPVSSPLGMVLSKKIRNSETIFETLLERTERYCSGTSESSPRTRDRNVNEVWPVTWKPPKENGQPVKWVHSYTFPSRHFKRIPRRGINSKWKRRLKNCKVVLKRLSKAEIKFYTSKKKHSGHSRVNTFSNLGKRNGAVKDRAASFTSESQKKSREVIGGQASVEHRSIHSDFGEHFDVDGFKDFRSPCSRIVERDQHSLCFEKSVCLENSNAGRTSCPTDIHEIFNVKNSSRICNPQNDYEVVNLSASDNDSNDEESVDKCESSYDVVNTCSLASQLIPNTLYGYKEILPVDSDPSAVCVIDLCSSDEESEEVNSIQGDCGLHNSGTIASSVTNDDIIPTTIRQSSELNSSVVLPHTTVDTSSFVTPHPPELFEIFTPHLMQYFPPNDTGAVNPRASRTTSNNQSKHTRVRVSTLENQPVMNNNVSNGGIKQYESTNKFARRSGLRTRNFDDLSKMPRVIPGFYSSGAGNPTHVKGKHNFVEEPRHWTPEELVSTYYILPAEK